MESFEDLKFKLKQGNAIVQIVLLNLAVFLFFAILGVFFFLFQQPNLQANLLKYLMLPAAFSNFIMQPWSIISYMFLHEGFFHLLFNMLWLYWFGSLFQQYLGNSKTYQAYFLGGIFGGIVYILAFNFFPAFSNQVPFSYALGASAGVLSLVVATATLLPDYQVFLFIFGAVRLKYIALVSVFLDLISIPNGNAGGHIAHLGGAAFGFFFIKLIYSQSALATAIDQFFNTIAGWFEPSSKVKIKYKNTGFKTEPSNKPSQIEIDSILDKIAKNGYESLNKKEKEILFKASKE